MFGGSRTQKFTVKMGGGQDRSKPRHQIGDSSLWTAENVRFKPGVVKPLPTASDLYNSGDTFSNPTTTKLITVIGKDLKPAAGVQHNFACIAFNNTSVDDRMIFSTDDAYGDSVNIDDKAFGSGYSNHVECVANTSRICVGVSTGTSSIWYKDEGEALVTDVHADTDFQTTGYNAWKLQVVDNILIAMCNPALTPQIAWTDVGLYTAWATGAYGATNVWNQRLQSIHKTTNGLVGYCEKSMFFMQYVGPPTTWTKRQISGAVGCYGPFTVNDFMDKHIFISDLTTRNVFIYGGGQLMPIGDPIRDLLFTTILKDTADKTSNVGIGAYLNGATIFSQVDDTNREVVFIFTDMQDYANQAFLIYNYELNTWSWGGLGVSDEYITCMGTNNCSTVRYGTVDVTNNGGDSPAAVLKVKDFTGGTEMRAFKIETKAFDFGLNDQYKRLMGAQLIFSQLTAEEKEMYVTVQAGDEPHNLRDIFTFTIGVNNVTAELKGIDITAKYFALKITPKDLDYSQPWELSEINWYFIPRGRK